MLRLTRFQRLALCGGLAALCYLVGLGGPALWEPDEGRYAEVARAMTVSGDYVTPRDNGVRYFEKPPLVYWASAVAIRVFGRNEFAIRLPAALASAGTVVLTAVAGETMCGPAVGMMAGLALGLSPLFFIFARVATPDPELAFFFSAALLSFYAAATRDFRNSASRRWMLAAAALLALATLVKGPVALVLGGAIGLFWLVGEGRGREVAWIHWPECVALYLAITAPWFVVAAWRNPGFLTFFFLHEHVQRFMSDTEHGWGLWFFVPIAIAGTWPFFYFVPSGIVALRTATADTDGTAEHGALRFILTWFGVVLIFFSIPRSKLGEYLLPGLPPLAILAGAGLDRIRAVPPPAARRLLRGFAGINAVIGLTVAAILSIMHRQEVAALFDDVILPALLMGAAATLCWLRQPSPRAISPVVAAFALGLCATLAMIRDDATPMYSYRGLAQVIAPQLEHGCALASYHHFVQALPFYTGRQEKLVGYRGELAPFGGAPDAASAFIATDAALREAWSAPACMVLIVNRVDWTRLAAILTPAPILLGCEGKKAALVNRIPPIPQTAPADPNRKGGCWTPPPLPH